MAQNEGTIEIVNDLIRINNDRIQGYQRAEKEIHITDTDLKMIFNRMIGESRNYLNQLQQEVEKLGGKPAEGATGAGKLYRAWMEVKATFTGNDRHSTLAACEYGEDSAQRAYNEALKDLNLDLNIVQLITSQKESLKASHDEIKRLRDASEIKKEKINS